MCLRVHPPQDKYLHTNCLAALANMSAQFRCLHQYAAQRIIRWGHAEVVQMAQLPLTDRAADKADDHTVSSWGSLFHPSTQFPYGLFPALVLF